MLSSTRSRSRTNPPNYFSASSSTSSSTPSPYYPRTSHPTESWNNTSSPSQYSSYNQPNTPSSRRGSGISSNRVLRDITNHPLPEQGYSDDDNPPYNAGAAASSSLSPSRLPPRPTRSVTLGFKRNMDCSSLPPSGGDVDSPELHPLQEEGNRDEQEDDQQQENDQPEQQSKLPPKSPLAGGIFGGWLSGKPSPLSVSTSLAPITKGDDDAVSPAIATPSSGSSSNLSPDDIQSHMARRISFGGFGSANTSEATTPRNPSPAPPTAKRMSLLQTSLSAITRLAVAPSASEDRKCSNMEESATVDPNDEDELLHIDIEDELYKDGSPTAPLTTASHKAMEKNALALLRKLHNAYRCRTMTVRGLEADRDSQKDDLIKARTRAIHLKQQVDNMTRQAAEHERSMMELMNELAAQKRARASENNEDYEKPPLNIVPERPESSKRESSIMEDLGVEDENSRGRNWRKSATGTIRTDVTFDTDEESLEADSIFSRSRSPTLPPISTAPTAPSSEASITPTPSKMAGPQPPAPSRSRSSLQMSAFQKILKGMTKEEENCRNCQSQDVTVAWDTVGLLRDENKALKSRVTDLETAVDGALDVINMVGM